MNQAVQTFQKLFRRKFLRRSCAAAVVLLPVGGALTRGDLLSSLVVSAVVQQRIQAAVRVQQGDGQGLLQVDGVISVHPVGSFDLLHL